jgi:hypothetical protein
VIGASPVVVLVGELVEERLELCDRARLGGLGAEPLVHGLLEPLGFSAGGGVCGAGVLLDDVAAAELSLGVRGRRV